MIVEIAADAAFSTYRAGFPAGLIARLRPYGLCLGGQRLLDVGTGDGDLARRLVSACDCTVVGLDPSTAVLDQARALSVGMPIEYIQASAEATGRKSAEFDGAVAGQCWHWLDRPKAARELARVLRPGAVLAICHFDWLPRPGNVVAATEDLIRKWNPAWPMGGGTGIYPQWLADLAQAGFVELETFSVDVDQPHPRAEWRDRLRGTVGIAGRLSPQLIHEFDMDLGRMLDSRFPGEPLTVPHRLWVALGRRKHD